MANHEQGFVVRYRNILELIGKMNLEMDNLTNVAETNAINLGWSTSKLPWKTDGILVLSNSTAQFDNLPILQRICLNPFQTRGGQPPPAGLR